MLSAGRERQVYYVGETDHLIERCARFQKKRASLFRLAHPLKTAKRGGYSPLSLRNSNLLVPRLVKLRMMPFFRSADLMVSRNCLAVFTGFKLTSVIMSPGRIPFDSAALPVWTSVTITPSAFSTPY